MTSLTSTEHDKSSTATGEAAKSETKVTTSCVKVIKGIETLHLYHQEVDGRLVEDYEHGVHKASKFKQHVDRSIVMALYCLRRVAAGKYIPEKNLIMPAVAYLKDYHDAAADACALAAGGKEFEAEALQYAVDILTEYVEKHIPPSSANPCCENNRCCDNEIKTITFHYCNGNPDPGGEQTEYLCGDCLIVREHIESIECMECDNGWYEAWDEHDDNTVETLHRWMVEYGFLQSGDKYMCGDCVNNCVESGAVLNDSTDWVTLDELN